MEKQKIFYHDDLATALDNCQKEGYKAMFMPELADARIKAGKDSELWQKWYSTPSLRATGKTKQGNAVVVYAHVPNHFSNPENIEKAVKEGLVSGAGIMPQKEFQKLVDAEDSKKVFVVDYDKLKNSKCDVISVDFALEHPQTIPFLGGEKRAEKYLEKHKQVYRNKIGIWHSDDLKDNPVGRVLFVGCIYDYDGLYGSYDLGGCGGFCGVQSNSPKATQKNIKAPNLNQILKVSKDYVPKASKQEFEQKIRELYK